MTEPKCPDCEGTELDIKTFSKKIDKYYIIQIHALYCLKCGKIISTHK